jgi:hypothetical protein
MMTDYQIQSSTRRCAASGRELQPGEKYFTVLIDQGDRFVRQDYSAEAWQGPPPEAFSFWATRVPLPESRRRPAIDDEMLLECFQRLEGQEDAGRLRFRYVLALLLMRRRRFRFEEAKIEAGREVLCLRCSRTGASFRVVNPRMTEAETKAVQDEVFQALGWE